MTEKQKIEIRSIDRMLDDLQPLTKARCAKFNALRDRLVALTMHEAWTADKFLEVIGRLPEDDDLERVNCRYAGTAGHYQCGVCEHGKPRFMCSPCFAVATESTHT